MMPPTPPELSAPPISRVWRRLDQPGHDAARFTESAAGSIVEGTAVFVEAGEPCRLEYRVECDTAWRTLSAVVRGWCGPRNIALDIKTDVDARWLLNGVDCPDVRGCTDIDLSFTPATNLLPIRRLRLGMDEHAVVRAAWLRFPECTLEPLDQSYTRTGVSTFWYESHGGAFATTLEVSADGLIASYPGLWRQEE